MAKKDQQRTKISTAEVEALLQRIRDGKFINGDMLLLEKIVELFLAILVKVGQTGSTIKKLRSFLFGESKGNEAKEENSDTEQSQEDSKQPEQAASSEPKPKRKGHGRKPASACTGAKIVLCQQEQLQAGAPCPDKICNGHLHNFYRRKSSFIRYEGQPPIGATRYDQELFRCSACTTLYTAKLPDGVLPEKFAPSADASIVIAKYGSGTPFNRLSRWQANFGIPLSASVMWERVLSFANALLPTFQRS